MRDDHEIARGATAGVDAAFAQLAASHRAALVAYARRRLGCAQDAEDAVQDALVNAYRALAAGQAPANPRAWLFVIVRNRCEDLRQARRAGEPLTDGLPGAVSAADGAAHNARVRDLVSAISALPASQRDMVVGREFEGRTYEELAARHATSVSAVKSLLVRARRKLAAAPALQALSFPVTVLQRWAVQLAPSADAPVVLAGKGTAAAAVTIALVAGHPAVSHHPPPAKAQTQPREVVKPATAGSDRAPASAPSAPVRTPASEPTAATVVAACGDGAVLATFPSALLRRALAELDPLDAQYGGCEQQIRGAMLRAMAR